MLSKIYVDMPTDLVKSVKESLPELVEIARRCGRLIKSDYEHVGLYTKLQNHGYVMIERDNNPIDKQHACIMTHSETVRMVTQYQEGRDPETQAQRKADDKAVEAAEKLVAKDVKVQEKKQATRERNDAKKAAYKALSPEEKTEFKESEKQRISEKKRKQEDKTAIADEKVSEAKRLLQARAEDNMDDWRIHETTNRRIMHDNDYIYF